jgi:hypothetical protein
MNCGFSNRSRPSSTRSTAGLRLSYRTLPVGTPPKISNDCTCPSRNASVPTLPYAMCAARPEFDSRITNMCSCNRSPAMIATKSPKSTSASAPGRWVCGTATRLRSVPISIFRSCTNARIVDSDTRAPCSSSNRCHTRRAVCRCFRGSDRSASNQDRTVASHGPDTGHGRTGTFRSGGTASTNAARTVRRCTRCRDASSRIDNSSSR